MKIEPCPFCGSEVRFDLGDLSAKCESCFYTGPTDDNEAASHNRLSRIVRAAEQVTDKYEKFFQKKFSYCPMEEFERAEHEYTDSVIRLGEIVSGMPPWKPEEA